METDNNNISLKELFEIEKLSVRSQNICEWNNLNDLVSILHYYWENNDFFKLQNCDQKSNTELICLCKKYEDFGTKFQLIASLEKNDNQDINQIVHNYSIEELAKVEKLGVRSCNACKFIGILNLKDLIEFHLKNGDFLNIRNCGHKSNDELINICQKYQRFKIDDGIINERDNLNNIEYQNLNFKKIDNLSIKQKAVLNNIISSKYHHLSVRSQNALFHQLNKSITIGTINEEFFCYQNYDIKKIKNVGELAEQEISNFLKEIEELIDLVYLFDENEIFKEFYSTYLIKYYQVSLSVINEISNNYDYNFGYPIFKTIHLLVKGNYLFSDNEKSVFFSLFNIFNSEPAPLNGYMSTIGLSYERCRQIRNKLFKKIPNKIDCLFNLEFSFEKLNTYQLTTKDIFINLSYNNVLEINKNEKVDFNTFFIVYVFSILLKETHSLIGEPENVFFNKIGINEHKWNNFYLIANELSWLFDFAKFIEDVQNRLNDRIEEDYSFHFETYLLKFLKNHDHHVSQEIIQISETILFNEYQISLDSYDNLIFKRNTFKQVVDYVYEVLKKENKPLTVYKIYDLIEKKYPGVTKSPEALRGSCQRDNNLIYFGRSSTYGLKVWEDQFDLKGGTIRSIAEEYLKKAETPKHIFEVTEYISQYRETNSKSILSNLKLDESKTFIFFNQSFIGLAEKNNSKEYKRYISLPKFLGKSIMTYVRSLNTVSINELRNFIFSKTELNNEEIEMIINQLIHDKYLDLEKHIIAQNDGKNFND